MRAQKDSGFTLIELLVVISIIALLAGMLFPVFTHTRESAMQTRCLSNVKQLAAGCLMYADEYNGIMPYPGGEKMSYRQARGCALPAFSEDLYGGIEMYIKGKSLGDSVWRCPKALKAAPGVTLNDGSSFPTNYSMNDYLRPYNRGYSAGVGLWPFQGLHSSKVESPSKTILIFESAQALLDSNARRSGTAFRNGSPHFPITTNSLWKYTELGQPTCFHGNKMTVAFCDGHVRSYFPPDTWSAVKPDGSVNFGRYRTKPGLPPVRAVGRFPTLPDLWMPWSGYDKYPSQSPQ